MQQELIEEYIKNQIKAIASENNINKDTLLSLKKLMAKCDHFADIIDYYAEMPECSIDGIECCKLFDLWCALDVLKSTKVTEEVLPETIDATYLNGIYEPINYSLSRVFNFTTKDPSCPNLCVVVTCRMTDAVMHGFTYNSEKVLKSFTQNMSLRKIHELFRRARVKLTLEDVNYKYDLIKLPVKTQRILVGYAASKMLVETKTYNGPYGNCTYSNRYIEERTDEFGNPALYQISKDYGSVNGEYDLEHMHLGNLSLARSFTMPELLCHDLAYSSCIKPVNIANFSDESKALFERMSKQKPDNYDILSYIRDNAKGQLDKLPGAAILNCQTKEEADKLLALLN